MSLEATKHRPVAASPKTIDDVYDELVAVRADLAELRKLLMPSQSRWISVEMAAILVGRSEQCVRKWARDHGLGTMERGAWQIDMIALKRFMLARFGASRLPVGLR